VLDRFYSERRFARWGRSMLPREPFPLIAGFAAHEVQRALAALPLADKLTDGFHRRFVAERFPELTPHPPELPRRGVPRLARRAAHRVRTRRRPAAPEDLWISGTLLQIMGDDWIPTVHQAGQAASLAALEDAVNRLPGQ
jgi:hypothetical protein